MNAPVWSDLHLDYITHYGDTKDFRRATVCIIGTIYQLSKWYKGCGFSPSTVNYNTFEGAKQAGEDWFHKGI